MSERKIASEDEPGEKWDRCIADAIVKTGTGFGLGLAFSLILFKRRPWPVALGGGFGLGYATSNCQHDFKRVESVYFKRVKRVQPPIKMTSTEVTPPPTPPSPPDTQSTPANTDTSEQK